MRELHNRLERACILSERSTLEVADLFEERQADTPTAELPTLHDFVADAEKAYLASVLARFGGRVGAAAQALGISRKTLWEKSKRYGLGASE